MMLAACLAAAWIAPYPPNQLDPKNLFQSPSREHLLGTDELGRDLFSRMLYGGQTAFMIMIGATVLAIVLGTAWGAAAASARASIDELAMRLGDINLAIPPILLALIIVAAFGPSELTLIVTLGLIFAPSTARIMRAAVSTELSKDYRLAAVASGSSSQTILRSEIIPNTVPALLAQTSLVAAGVVITEASLSFIGLGVQPPRASWGTLLQTGYSYSAQSVWYVVFPLAAIGLLILMLNTLGDSLQEILDPATVEG